jgi:hypothetical protein
VVEVAYKLNEAAQRSLVGEMLTAYSKRDLQRVIVIAYSEHCLENLQIEFRIPIDSGLLFLLLVPF